MLDGFYQSLVSFFFPFFTYLYGVSVSESGRQLDHRFWMGLSICTIAVVSCNLYVLSNQYRWDVASLGIAGLSSLCVWIWSGIYSSFTGSMELYKLASQMYGAATFWAVSFLGIITCMTPHYVIIALQKIYRPQDIDIIREQWTVGIFDSVPPITEEYDGLTAASAFERHLNSGGLILPRDSDSRAVLQGSMTNPGGVGGGPHRSPHSDAALRGKAISSDEEGSEDTYHGEKDLSSSSSGSHNRRQSLTKRLSIHSRRASATINSTWSRRKSSTGVGAANGEDLESDEEILVSPHNQQPPPISPQVPPQYNTHQGYASSETLQGPYDGESVYPSSTAGLSPVPSSLTGHPVPSYPRTGGGSIASQGGQGPTQPKFGATPTVRPVNSGPSSSGPGGINENYNIGGYQQQQQQPQNNNNNNFNFNYKRHEYPENDEVDMRAVRKSLDMARSGLRNEQQPARLSMEGVGMTQDLGDDLTTAEGLMRTYTRQRASLDDETMNRDSPSDGQNDHNNNKRHSRLDKIFHHNKK